MFQQMDSSEQERAGEHDAAADGGDGEEASAEPGGDRTCDEGERADPPGAGGVDDGGEGHDREGHVRHVVEERLHKAVLDGLADEGHRHDADGVGDREHDEDVEVVVMHGCPHFPRGRGLRLRRAHRLRHTGKFH